MKILHFSDTHLGITLENTPREYDFYHNFEKVISEIISQKPDVVIHSGDLFHTSKPSNKAIAVVVENFLKLQHLGIKIIIIAGNHDTPRLSTTTHPFEIFESMEHIEVFYEPQISHIKIEKCNFICLPHIHDENIFKQELLKAKDLFQKGEKNIFISHFGISAKEYDEYTDEISGISLSLEELKILKLFDYVALGHYHKQFCIGKMCYPGSIEHTSFNQKDYMIGYNIFESNTGEIHKLELPSRKMIDLGEIDCIDFSSSDEVISYLEANISQNITGAIVKIVLKNMKNTLLLEWREKDFLKFFEDTFYFEYKKIQYISSQDISQNITQSDDIIADNFDDFFKNYHIENPNIDREELGKELGEKIRLLNK